MSNFQKEDQVLCNVWRCWQSGWSPGDQLGPQSGELKSWLKEYSKLVEEDGVLYRRVRRGDGITHRQLLVPSRLRSKLLTMAHDEWGHQGISRTQSLLKEKCFWPGLHKDVEEHVKRCFTCITTKAPTPAVRTPRRHLLAFRPLELLAIDFLKLDKGKGGFEDVLVLTDAFTKYAQAVPCRDQTAPVVARALRDNWINHYGSPLRIHTDQGRNFESALIKELCKLYGIQKSHTTPYHPQGNGQTERFNRTLCGMIRSLDPVNRRRWPELLGHLVYLYNCTPHQTTKASPYRLMFGREPYTPLDQLLSNARADWDEEFVTDQAKALEEAHRVARERMESALQAEKKRHDRLPMSTPIEVGMKVLLKRCAFQGRHKLADKYHRDTFVVVWTNKEADVLGIRPLFGGPVQTVNRSLLIRDPRELPSTSLKDGSQSEDEADLGDLPLTPLENGSQAENEVDQDGDTDQDTTDDYGSQILIPPWLFAHSRSTDHRDTDVGTPTPLSPRRSARSTKGQHSNPFKLPR